MHMFPGMWGQGFPRKILPDLSWFGTLKILLKILFAIFAICQANKSTGHFNTKKCMLTMHNQKNT